jgi:hypothetical protein
MHYSFIISDRQGQIDLHFEPSPVFSDISNKFYYNPLAPEYVHKENYMTFPYEYGMLKDMINKFGCRDYCGRNLTVLVIRVQESNSVFQNVFSELEKCILHELTNMGMQGFIIDSEYLLDFKVNINSLFGEGIGKHI